MADFPIENTTNRDNFKLALALASTDLTDSTAAGRTLLTAASASAQRTALDVLQSSAAATAAQGALADSAVQPGDIGTAAAEDVGYFATAAQGTLASNSVQKDGGWTYSSSGGNVLIASPDTDDAANATSIPATALPRTDTSQSFTTGQKQQVAANIGSDAGAASTLVATDSSGDITVGDVNCTNVNCTDIEATTITVTDITISGTLSVFDVDATNDITCVNLTASGDITGDTLAGNGASITGLTSSQITDATALATANKIAKRGAAGDCAFTALTATTGTFSDDVSMVDVTASGNGSIGGTLGVTSNATVGGTLGVTGAATLSSTLDVSGTITASNGLSVTNNITCGGSLSLTSNTTVGGTLGVTGATTLSSTLAVTGNTTVGGTLGVTGDATFGTIASVTSLTVDTAGIVDLSGTTLDYQDGTFATLEATSNTTVGGTLGVTGATTLAALSATTGAFSSTLGVTGAATLSSTLAVTGNTTVGGTLGVTGTGTFAGQLNCEAIDATLDCTADAFSGNSCDIVAGGFGTIAATGAATVGGTLGVTGNTTLGGTLGVTSNATVGGTLGVTGNTTLGGTLAVGSYERHKQLTAFISGAPANQPTQVAFDTVPGLQFAAAGTEYAYCEWEIPEDWDGGDVVVEVDWFPDSGSMNGTSDTVKWDLAYRSIAEGETTNNGTLATDSVTFSDALVRYTTKHTAFTIPYNDASQPLAAGDHIYFRFTRDTGDAFAGTVTVPAFEIVYNSVGLPTN